MTKRLAITLKVLVGDAVRPDAAAEQVFDLVADFGEQMSLVEVVEDYDVQVLD